MTRPEHVSRPMLCAYVSRELGVAETRWLEAHVETCPACAHELAGEAQAELLLFAAAEQDRASRRERSGGPVLGRESGVKASLRTLASAAAVMLLVLEPMGDVASSQGGGRRVAPALGRTDDAGSWNASTTCWQPNDASVPCDDTVALATFPDDDNGLEANVCTSVEAGDESVLVCDSDEPARG